MLFFEDNFCVDLKWIFGMTYVFVKGSVYKELFLCGGVKMKCPKCKGRMYTEKCYDFVRAFDAWKCSACGEVIDPVILSNRIRHNRISMG